MGFVEFQDRKIKKSLQNLETAFIIRNLFHVADFALGLELEKRHLT
jgi:hypothetical protein